jgi:hypothetical protein
MQLSPVSNDTFYAWFLITSADVGILYPSQESEMVTDYPIISWDSERRDKNSLAPDWITVRRVPSVTKEEE